MFTGKCVYYMEFLIVSALQLHVPYQNSRFAHPLSLNDGELRNSWRVILKSLRPANCFDGFVLRCLQGSDSVRSTNKANHNLWGTRNLGLAWLNQKQPRNISSIHMHTHTCTSAYGYTQILYMHASDLHFAHASASIHTYECAMKFTFTLYTRIHLHTYVHIDGNVNTYRIHAYTYAHVSTYTKEYMCIYAYTYIHIHIHSYTCTCIHIHR